MFEYIQLQEIQDAIVLQMFGSKCKFVLTQASLEKLFKYEVIYLSNAGI